MKQTIRYNTFETNSSSMHSLVVVNEPKPYTKNELALNYFGLNSFSLFYFNDEDDATFEKYPFQVLSTPVEKLRYYVAHEIGTRKKLELIPKVKEFISKQTGVDVDHIEIGVKEYGAKRTFYGYASDNDTGESPFEYIKRKKLSMEELVLNPKYIIIVDGDEYCEFRKLFDRNVIGADMLEDISSGIDFWTRPYYDLSRVVIEAGTPESLTEGINNKIKAVCICLEATDIKWYNQNVKKIEAIKRLALVAAPGAKFVLKNYTWNSKNKKITEKKLKLLNDISFFDDIDFEANKYTNYPDVGESADEDM